MAIKPKKKQTAAKKSSANKKRPWLAAALICEQILQEGEVATLVRVIDTVQITADGKVFPPGVINFKMFLQFRSDEAIGHRKVFIKGYSPDKQEILSNENMLEFKGGVEGCTVRVDVSLGVTKPGLYWFDILINTELMTRVPMRVQHLQPNKE